MAALQGSPSPAPLPPPEQRKWSQVFQPAWTAGRQRGVRLRGRGDEARVSEGEGGAECAPMTGVSASPLSSATVSTSRLATASSLNTMIIIRLSS